MQPYNQGNDGTANTYDLKLLDMVSMQFRGQFVSGSHFASISKYKRMS